MARYNGVTGVRKPGSGWDDFRMIASIAAGTAVGVLGYSMITTIIWGIVDRVRTTTGNAPAQGG